MKDTLIGITTYQKSDALQVLLESIYSQGYHNRAVVHIADDNCGQRYSINHITQAEHPLFKGQLHESTDIEMSSALEVYEQFKEKMDITISYGEVPRGGVSRNKNRNIQYFLQNKDFKYLILIDDDQWFAKYGLIEEFVQISQDNNIQHLTGIWAEIKAQAQLGLDGRTWYDSFPIKALSKDEKISWHEGCHGSLGFFTRKCIDRIHYYHVFTGRYSYEHDEFTSRAQRAVEKRSPQWKPQINSAPWLKTQAIPNNYFDTAGDIKLNAPEYYAKLAEIEAGLNLRCTDPGFDPTKETTLRSW